MVFFYIQSNYVNLLEGDVFRIRATVYSEGDHVKVQNIDEREYRTSFHRVYNSHLNAFFINAQIDSEDGDIQNALWISDSISDAHDHFSSEYNIVISKVPVNWQSGADPEVFTMDDDDTDSFYDRSLDTIYIDGLPLLPGTSDDSQRRFTILHEYGHHIMNSIYGSNFPPTANCSGHTFGGSTGNEGCAWTEGWADFVPSLVDNASVYKWYNDTHIDLERAALVDDDEDLSGNINNPAITILNGNLVGQTVEGRVAAALWDITDNSSHPDHDFIDNVNHDMMAEGSDKIMMILEDKPRTFKNFDKLWNEEYASTFNIMKMHSMDFVTLKPTATPQTVTVQSGETVDITLTGSDPENDILSFSIVTDPKNGTLDRFSINSSEHRYTPNNNAVGMDSFTFRAFDGHLSSEPATVHINIISGPTAPTNVRTTSTSNSITLNWHAPTDPVTGYQILRGTSSSLGILVTDTGSTATTYVDSAVEPDTAYSYQIKSVSTGGRLSEPSNTVQVRTQIITVVQSSLRITAPVDVTVEATSSLTTVDIGNAIATHDTDTNITITNNATASFHVGNTTVIWTATDSSGIMATATQIVTVQDTTPPVFDPAPANIDKTLMQGNSTVVTFDALSVTDLADSDVDMSCSPPSGSTFGEGRTTVTCTATDDSGNIATASFVVDIVVTNAALFQPAELGAKVTDSEVVLMWYQPALGSPIGYQVLRDSGFGLSVLVNDTQSTDTAYIDRSV